MTGRVALVTGGTGFVGSHLVRRLVSENWQVHVIIRPGSDSSELSEQQNQLLLHVHDGSIASMQQITDEAKPDVVFHLASLFLSEHQSQDIEPLVTSNLLFGTQLVEAMSKAGVNRLINTGTSWQHYESRDYSPVNLYAATKQAFEAVSQYYVEARGLRVITLKLYDTYGMDDPRPKLLNLLKSVAETGQRLDMSSGEQLIDLVHINDVVEAYIVAAQRLLSDEVVGCEQYAISSGQSLPLKELVMYIDSILKKKLEINWGGKKYRDREVMEVWSSGPQLPNWVPNITIGEGLVEAFLCNSGMPD